MKSYSPSYLDRLNNAPQNIARFITRIPEVEISTDRKATIANLLPAHNEVLEQASISPKLLRRAQQVHGARVAMVGDIGSPFPVEGVDGLICSHNADCCLGIYVADCAAVWIYDQVIGTRALVHSGKLGTEHNIVGEALKCMHKFDGSNAENCIAVISPCIRPPHYEIDIASEITEQLIEAGVKAGNVVDAGLDTASDIETFYSYRVEKGNTGRMLALFGRIPH